MDPASELLRRYLTIYESELIGVLSTDASGLILDANDYFLRLVGYTRDDLEAGRLNWKALTPPEFAEESQEVLRQLQEKPGVSISFDKEYFHKDGHRIPIRLGVTRFHDGTIITLALDITKQKQVENELEEANARLEEHVLQRTKQLEESEAFLSGIIENMPSMVFVKDAVNLSFVRLNRAGEELLGISRHEFIGKNDFDFFSKEVAEMFRTMDRRVLSGEIPYAETEDVLPTRNGDRIIHTIKMAIRNQDGEPRYLLGVTEDITESKEHERQRAELVRAQAEKESAEWRARQEKFVSEVSFALSRTFETQEILKSFAEKMVPLLADVCTIEVIDEDSMDIVFQECYGTDPEEVAFIRKWRSENAPRWKSQSGESSNVISNKTVIVNGLGEIKAHVKDTYHPDVKVDENSRLVSEAFMLVPLVVRDGKPLGFVSYVSTHSKRRFNKEDQVLAERVCGRLAILIENSRLYYRSQDASRAKSDFLANVSHEIRTPLGAMLGFAEILREDERLAADQRKSVDTVLKNGHQLLKIVNEILDISKIESEKIQLENAPFSLHALLVDVIQLMRASAEDKGIELRLVHASALDAFIADSNRLRQILINIVGNAIKFTEKGYVELAVEVQESAEPKEVLLRFTISDTGIGISQDQRTHLFQPFSQADTSTTRRFGGTGLGLFLSRKLARLMGGDIYFSSAPQQGSRFFVSVAAQKTSEMKLSDVRVSINVAPMQEARDIGLILVVDDAPDNRELFKRYLQKVGVPTERIVLAENGEEAIQKCQGQTYDFILMDIQMPKMDGFQALRTLRSQGYQGKIVALTAHAMKGDKEKCLDAGFDDYLAKPLKREALQEVLSRGSEREN
ncbi:PAS domain S-box protein [Bdellovibrio sp. HCB209]|uniref:PAS domain-containing hybrid sensor histidine kinase/response regulator n=1 Tax=Bdellovibrio sp. HCB209 TaxID=3394354 RepID=UPI0039B4B97E